MIRKKHGVMAAALMLGLASCSDDNPWLELEAGHGAISISLTTDGSVKDAAPGTRADGDALFDIPTASDHFIHLKRADGSTHTHKAHDEFADFARTTTFPVGSYVMTAYSGNINDEGFDKPYFEGETELTVIENKTTRVQVETRLANTLVSVDYTDAFKNYMKDYKAMVHSEGHGYIDIPKGEKRPVFLVPGNVGFAINFTNSQGKELTLQPADFTAKPATHYHVTVNVNDGQVGDAQLEIILDSSLESEVVTIDLTDELFTAPEPKVTTAGFNDGDDMELLTGDRSEDNLRFNVISYGGLNSVKLTINSLEGGYKPSFGNEIDLITASESVQGQLKAMGIDCKGVFRNPDKLAYIDVSGLPSALPSGKYEVYVVAKDMLGRITDPVKLIITSVAPTLELTPDIAFSEIFEGYVIVNYNGANPGRDITFTSKSKNGLYEEAPVIDWEEYTATRAIEGKNYRFHISMADFGSFNPVNVKAYIHGQEAGSVNLPVEKPTGFVVDAFAKKVMIKVVDPKGRIESITNAVKISDADGLIAEDRISRDASVGMITVTGLKPASDYTYTFSGYLPGMGARKVSFTTEAAANVPNGDFSQLSQSLNIGSINAGGKYSVRFLATATYQNTTSINIWTPTGWGNINGETCDYNGSSNKNTWYCVPSTLTINRTDGSILTTNSGNEDRAVIVRSVAYDKSGVEITTDNQGSSTTSMPRYCRNMPSEIKNKAAGELFLQNGVNGGKADGVSFSSRPSTFNFEYKYVPVAGTEIEETGEAYLKIMDASNKVLAEKTISISSTGDAIKKASIQLGDYEFGSKAAKVCISFRSTRGNDIKAPFPTDINDQPNTSAPGWSGQSGYTLPVNSAKTLCVGSVLTLYNISFGY